jgi:hypothetical protein
MTDSTQSAPDTTTSAAADVQSGAPVQTPAADQAPVTPDAPAVSPAAEAAGQPEAAPVEYADFKVAEGFELDADALNDFKGIAKELGIPQEAAQKLIDLQTSLEGKRSEAQQQAQADQAQKWAEAVKADKEIGGEHYDKSVATAVKAIEQFGSPELRNLLSETGIGNHPELVKFCHRIGKALSEDGLVMGGAQNAREMSIVDAFK